MATTTVGTSPLGTSSTTSALGTAAGGTGLGAGTYGKVILTLKSAHDLLDKTWIGKADPYCVVKVADAEIQTQHVKNAGDHAVWEESFAFNNVAPDDVIEFKVYDHNRLMKDSLMGTGSLSMRQVFVEGRLEARVPLTSRTGSREAGEIWVSLHSEGGRGGAGRAAVGTAAATAGLETGYERGTAATTTTTTRTSGAARGPEALGVETSGPAVTEYGAGTASAVPAAATTGVATTAATAATGEAVQTGREAVCAQEYFTKVEDRPVVKERVTYLREHRPVEKEYVVETRSTGVERQLGAEQEHMGAQDRIVSMTPPAPEEHAEEYFTKTEDRPVVKERVTMMKEHRPVEKEYVVETRATGVERDTGVREHEHLGAQDRIVSVAPPAPEEHAEEYFTKTEDRPVVIERVTMMKEHRPVEKEYVVETRATGVERDTGVREHEHLGAQNRVVSAAEPGNPCD